MDARCRSIRSLPPVPHPNRNSAMLNRLLAAIALLAAATSPGWAQNPPGMLRVGAWDVTSLRQWDRRIDSMMDDGELRIRQTTADTDLPGRTHQRAGQYYKGVPV